MATLGEDMRRYADLARFVVHKVIWSHIFEGFERRKVARILECPHRESQEQRRCDPIRR